jgi:hypothetical protein
MKSVCCQCYDWSPLHLYLPMILLVFCGGKMTSLILLQADPPNKTLWHQYYCVMPTPSINYCWKGDANL